MHPTDIPHSSAADTSVLNSPSTAVHRPPSSSSLSSAFGNLGPPGLGQRHPSAGSTSNQLARGPDSSSPNTGGVTNLSNQPQLIQPGPPSVPHPIFEFTKRKRWADLLVTQLSEAILLVLSPQMNVLYCGSAVWALLGWQDHEWVDKCLLDFMNLDDRNTFQRLFTESMVNKTELTSYTRLQYKPSPSTSTSSLALANATASYPHSNAGHAPLPAPYHPYAQQAHVPYHQQASGPPQGQGPGPHGHHFGAPSPRPAGYHPQQGYTQTPQQRRQRDQGSTEGRKEVLFEIVGAPYFLPLEDTFKCFYAVAKPYPSRNTAILNTFLELKLENERLHDRLAQLKLSKPKHPLPSASSSSNNIPTIVPSNSTSTSPVTPSAGGQPHSISQPGSTSSSIAIPAATSFFGGTYNELMALPGQGQVVQGVSAPRYRFENLFHEDGELTMDTTTARPGGLDGLGISGSGPGGQGVSVGIDGLAGQGAGTVTGVGPGPGPVGGTVVMGEEDESAKKKARKVYLPEQYVCMTCGRTDSPEWRKGPSGPKTLCNACGLRWAKREKEKRAALRANGQSGTGLN